MEKANFCPVQQNNRVVKSGYLTLLNPKRPRFLLIFNLFKQKCYQGVEVRQLLLVVGGVLQVAKDLGRRETQFGRNGEDCRNHKVVESFKPEKCCLSYSP